MEWVVLFLFRCVCGSCVGCVPMCVCFWWSVCGGVVVCMGLLGQ